MDQSLPEGWVKINHGPPFMLSSLRSALARVKIVPMAKFIQRVTSVSLGGEGSTTLFKAKKKKSKKKQVSRWLRPIERRSRLFAEAAEAYGTELTRQHRRSNRKRRDGFLRDAPINMLRAQRKGALKLFKL